MRVSKALSSLLEKMPGANAFQCQPSLGRTTLVNHMSSIYLKDCGLLFERKKTTWAGGQTDSESDSVWSKMGPQVLLDVSYIRTKVSTASGVAYKKKHKRTQESKADRWTDQLKTIQTAVLT